MELESTGYRQIPVASITPNPNNPRKRFDEDKLQELAASIKEHGVVEPLVVVPAGDGYTLICGERRWRAAQLAECMELPCIVRDLTPEAASEIMLIENLQRQDLDPIEEAEGFLTLMRDHGYRPDNLAKAVGLSLGQLQERLKLLRLPEEVRDAVSSRRLAPTAALELLRVEGTPLAKDLAKRFVDDPPAARAAAEAVKREITWKGRAIHKNSYDFPFDLTECYKCPNAPMVTTGTNSDGSAIQYHYCLDDKCRSAKKKAWDKAQTEAALAADAGDAIDGSKLGSKDFVSMSASWHWRGIDQTECETCPNRRKVRFGANNVVVCCVNAVCHNNKRVAADADEREAEEARTKAKVQKVLDASAGKTRARVDGDTVSFTRDQIKLLVLLTLTGGKMYGIEELMCHGFNQEPDLWKDTYRLSTRISQIAAVLDGMETPELAGLLFDAPAWCRLNNNDDKWLKEHFGLTDEADDDDEDPEGEDLDEEDVED